MALSHWHNHPRAMRRSNVSMHLVSYEPDVVFFITIPTTAHVCFALNRPPPAPGRENVFEAPYLDCAPKFSDATPGESTRPVTRVISRFNRMKWRTGCEVRISLLKRRHGLNRCRYKGADGMRRWVGLGVIADNLINIGRALTTRPTR